MATCFIRFHGPVPVQNATEFREWEGKIIPTIVNKNKTMLEMFNKRLEFLNRLVQTLKGTLDTLEIQIGQAEQAFGLNSPFRNVLSYFVSCRGNKS